MTIDKFDPNLILVNINKLKHYQFVEINILKPIIMNPSEWTTKESVEDENIDLVLSILTTNHNDGTLVLTIILWLIFDDSITNSSLNGDMCWTNYTCWTSS